MVQTSRTSNFSVRMYLKNVDLPCYRIFMLQRSFAIVIEKTLMTYSEQTRFFGKVRKHKKMFSSSRFSAGTENGFGTI